MDQQGAGGKPPVKSQEDLRAHFGQLSPLAEKKVLNHIDKFCRDFIALSPFLVIASSDGNGHADASPRGDAPGFVSVIDDKTLLIPDRRGNNRVDTFGNIIASPGVGLIFMVPGINETLRINGRAEISQEPDLLTPLTVQNVTPVIGLKVHVDEVYFHCGKALMRSNGSNHGCRARSNVPLWIGSSHLPRRSRCACSVCSGCMCTCGQLAS